jgi:hypothetical protein
LLTEDSVAALKRISKGLSGGALVLALTGLGAQVVKTPYPEMAAVERYMMPESAEVALARTAAPAAISDKAEVIVLRRGGYETAVKGTNGWVCVVERGWASGTDAPDFWNPKLRAPICFNPAAARSFLPVYVMKTRMVMAGERSKKAIVQATEAAFRSKQLPEVESGSMCYMMSKQQYLGDRDKSWHPHLMFFVPMGSKSEWGADVPGSPILAADDPEEHVKMFLIPVGKWSDGSAAMGQ